MAIRSRISLIGPPSGMLRRSLAGLYLRIQPNSGWRHVGMEIWGGWATSRGNGDERHASRDDWRRGHFAANQLVERCDLFAANELVDGLIGKTGDDEACDDPVEPAAPVGPGRTRAVSSQFAGGADARLARPIEDCHAAALEFVGLSRRGVADNLGAGEPAVLGERVRESGSPRGAWCEGRQTM
jgi:hypothetical protein